PAGAGWMCHAVGVAMFAQVTDQHTRAWPTFRVTVANPVPSESAEPVSSAPLRDVILGAPPSPAAADAQPATMTLTSNTAKIARDFIFLLLGLGQAVRER